MLKSDEVLIEIKLSRKLRIISSFSNRTSDEITMPSPLPILLGEIDM